MSAIRRAISSSSRLLQIAGLPPSTAFYSSKPPADPTQTLGIHVFHCPDVVGIVAKLSECVASHGGNIRSVDVFVPESKQDHCLVDLLHGWQEGRLPVGINCVISNHDRAPNTHVIRFLERHGIPYYYLPTTSVNKREEEILNLIEDTDFLVLARYMQILSGSFLRSYSKDIINIHHGLLPSFKGSNPSRQAFDAGVKLIGVTSHFVTEELDAGPIIEQMVGRVSHKDTLQSFVQKSENLEKQCLAKAIKSYCELRVLPYELNRTIVF